MKKILKENLRSSTENQGNNSISTQKNFRFFDNRQKYLLFVSTCSEKEIISKRVGKEISLLTPSHQQSGSLMQGWEMGLYLLLFCETCISVFLLCRFIFQEKKSVLRMSGFVWAKWEIVCLSTPPLFWSLLIFSTMRPRGLDQKKPVQQIHWYGKSCPLKEIHLMISVNR